MSSESANGKLAKILLLVVGRKMSSQRRLKTNNTTKDAVFAASFVFYTYTNKNKKVFLFCNSRIMYYLCSQNSCKLISEASPKR